MSDFDQDDWLRDNRPDGDDSDDDFSFDWLQDGAEDQPRQASGSARTGVTGELDWLRAGDDEDADDADDIEWGVKPSVGGMEGTGLTGALDWQSTGMAETEEFTGVETDGLPDWLRDAAPLSPPPTLRPPQQRPPAQEESFTLDLFADTPPPTARKSAEDEFAALFADMPHEAVGMGTGELDANDELLAALGIAPAGIDVPDDDDLFGDINITPPAGIAQDLPGTDAYQDPFADLFGDAAPDPFAGQPQQGGARPSAADDTDDFFSSFDFDAAQTAEPFDFEAALSGDDPFAPAPAPMQASPDDFFTGMGFQEPQPSDFDFEEPEADDLALPGNTDFLSSVGLTPPPRGSAAPKPAPEPTPEVDWFSNFDRDSAPSAAQPDWLDDLDATADEDFGDPFGTPARAQDMPDLDALFGGVPTAPAGKAAASADDDFQSLRAEFGNLDDLLAAFDEETYPESASMQPDTSADFDALMDANDFSSFGSSTGSTPLELSPDAPDWLTGLAPSVTDTNTSAAAVVRQRKERPLDDLDPRLKQLRDEGLNLTAPESKPSPALASVLPGIKEALPAADITPSAPSLVSPLELTAEQRQKAALLTSLTGADAAKPTPKSAIDATYDATNLRLLDDEDADPFDEDPFAVLAGTSDGVPAQAEQFEHAPMPVSKARRRRTTPVGRVLLSLLIAAAVLLPFFVRSLRIGELPPASFTPGSASATAYQTVGAAQSSDLVLVAVEYGPAGAAELDLMTDSLLRHLLLKGARPVLIGTNPTGLTHAANLLERLAGDPAFLATIGRTAPLLPNQDYYVLRYLTANAIGVRALGSNPSELLGTDIRGASTGLANRTLADFALIIVIAERSEDLRTWMEQVVPLSAAQVVAATGYAAAPLAQPYLSARAATGLLVGYGDAYTYASLLDAGAPDLLDAPTSDNPPPSDEPATTVPTAPVGETEDASAVKTDEADVTKPPVEDPNAVVTDEAIETPAAQPTVTPLPTNTEVPSPTPDVLPSATPTQAPSATPTEAPSATPTAAEFVRIATVSSDTTARVRELPSTSAPVVGGLAPGTVVRVLGESPDFQWFNILLPDGSEGWIAAFLVDIEDVPPDEAPPLPPTPIGADFKAPRGLLKPAAQIATPTPEGFGDPTLLLTDAAATVTAAGVNIDDALATATALSAGVGAGLTVEDIAATATALNIAPGGVPESADDALLTATALNLSVDDLAATATALNIAPNDAFATATALAGFGLPPSITATPLEGSSDNATTGGLVRGASVADTGLRDERWYATTLGLIAVIGIIGISAIINILRGLRRRNKQA